MWSPTLYLGGKLLKIGLLNRVNEWEMSTTKNINEAVHNTEQELEKRNLKL